MIPTFALLVQFFFALWLTRHGSAVRATGAIGIGLIAMQLAIRSGLPIWTDWGFPDASDVGFLTFAGAWLAAGLVMK